MRTQFILIFLLALSLLAGCGEQDAGDVREPAHTLTTGKLGMWINPKQADMKYYDEALELAREAEIQIAHLYVQWGLVEKSSGDYDWEIPDYILGKFKKYGFEAVVVIPVIFTTKLDEMPSDIQFKSFSDPEFVERFVQFTRTLMDRYSDTIKYLVIGNEIDIYLIEHPETASDFRQLVKAVAEAHEVVVGTEYAIHSIVQNNSQSIAKEALAGDIVFFTLYPTEDIFSFGGSPQDVEKYFDAMIDVAGKKKIAVVETSWSSSHLLESSEETQAAYVKEIFRILKKNTSKIEFLMWLNLHDSTEEECRKAVEFFLVGVDDEVLKNEEYMARFSDFMCFMGLRRTDGTPKPAWYEWIEQVKAYYTG
jgi:beta-glucosidase/6-phospho-beta-glucosidase/beta-galactosidase